MTGPIVSTAWLAEHLDAPDVAILDASWYLPAAGRNAKAEYAAARIPGAQYFDIDKIADTASPLPHMLPAAEKFAAGVRKLGIGDNTMVIAYDSAGLFSAARAWWMFKVFGHDDVAVLDGGFRKWQGERRPVEEGSPRDPLESDFTARYQPMMVRDRRDVERVVEDGSAVIADARSPSRFRGDERETRAGVRSGHMPGARNVHYATLLNADGTLKAPEELVRIFADAGVDIAQPVITSCGSGVTAAMLTLGLTLIGARDHALYDGSWTEWGGDHSLPLATGS